MASEHLIKRLYEVSLQSTYFSGLKEADIWKACLAYKERPDRDIEIAMENIAKKDVEAKESSQKDKEALQKGKEKIQALHSQEKLDRQNDERMAEKILAKLFDL